MRIFKDRAFSFFLTIILSFFVIAFVTYATSVGTNVSVSGTLTSSGLSTLTGFISTASSTVSGAFTLADALYASTTLVTTGAVQFNSTLDILGGGLSTFSGGLISQASSTVVGAFTASDLYSSSTLAVTGASQLFSTFDVLGGGLSTFSGGLISSASSTVDSTLTISGLERHQAGFISNASSTVDAAFNVSGAVAASSTLQATGNSIFYGTLGVATTSISEDLGVDGDIAVNSSGTTTIMLSSSGSTVGSCIQLEGASSSATYRIYVGDRGDGTTLIAEVGSCQE